MSWTIDELRAFEDRGCDGFPYDAQSSSKILHPNGTTMETFDRLLSVALVRAVLPLHHERWES